MKRLFLFFPILPAAAWADDFPVYDGREIVVTASRFSQMNLAQPIGVTVITQDMINNSPAATLPQLLSELAGIQTRNNDGSQDQQIDLRGFGMTGNQNTVVMLDGVRMNDIELTSVRWSTIPLSSIDRIEVLRGAGSVIYGDGASGGVINIITKNPQAGKEAGTIGYYDGSYATHELRGSFSTAGDKAGVNLNMNKYNSDNYRANNQERRGNAEGDIRYDIGQGDISLKFGANTQNLRFPGIRTKLQLITDPRGTSTPGDYGTNDGGYVSLGARQNLSFGEFDAELSYRDKKSSAYFQSFGGSYLDTRSHVTSFTPRIEIPGTLANRENNLILGMDWNQWGYGSVRATSPTTIATPQANVIGGEQNFSAYLSDSLALSSQTSLTMGGRQQQVSLNANDAINPASYASGSKSRMLRAYEVGARHEIDRNLSFYGRIGTSFRIPTMDEVYNQYGGPVFDSIVTILEPQTSHDREVGMDMRSGASSLHAALYEMDLVNEIYYSALTFTNINLSPTRRYGLELEGRTRIAPSLESYASYTYAVAKFREGVYNGVNVAGNTVPLVPRQSATLGLAWSLAEKTKLDGVVNYVGRQYFDNDQSNTFGMQMPAYFTADMKLTREMADWTVTAAVDNLFNRNYFTYGVASTFTPGAYSAYPMRERAFMVGAQYKFK